MGPVHDMGKIVGVIEKRLCTLSLLMTIGHGGSTLTEIGVIRPRKSLLRTVESRNTANDLVRVVENNKSAPLFMFVLLELASIFLTWRRCPMRPSSGDLLWRDITDMMKKEEESR
jgi:hypothetical protein